MAVSPAITGASHMVSRPFEFSFNASGGANVQKAIAPGSYVVGATVDAYLTIGASPTAAAPAATQPAVGSPNPTLRLYANQPVPLDIPATGLQIALIAVGGAGGTCTVMGPISNSANR